MKHVDEIFGIWASMAEIGRDLGLPYTTVAAWKQRGSIPVAYWLGIISAARRRGHPEVTAELLIELHGHAGSDQSGVGFSEDAASTESERTREGDADGQFSRWKHLRRSHFATTEEVVDHVTALRSEWDRR
jgi:hypothetical protein